MVAFGKCLECEKSTISLRYGSKQGKRLCRVLDRFVSRDGFCIVPYGRRRK